MTQISPRHPRYASLRRRAGLAESFRSGLVVPEGLLAHGRGEAFDYLLGERTTASARRAARIAADWIRRARHPVLSVNGNVAALAAPEIAELVRLLPTLRVEVNLFHRTPARARAIAQRLRAAGVPDVLGVTPTARLPGLPSDRARIDRRGLGEADLAIIPLEDGDRAEALQRHGVRIIAIDLNPLSRTAQRADLALVDDLNRALQRIAQEVRRRSRRPLPARAPPSFDAPGAALEEIQRRLVRLSSSERRRVRSGVRSPARSSGRPR
ncbi:MAG: phosphopantothenate/pantothenate synthetase [Thermoplasmata archaeon]|nr:phosphopantothenate/pantothenate synthetase [Thermoplasmata archaeon]